MTTYSISLDDVDLALLPLPTHPYNNFLKKEHYQFQVMKSVPESATQYTCHICAIEVPVAFAYEHAASVKHRANVRIASVAAERMRAFISALPPPFAKPAGRFCSSCATEVDEGHEKTKEHRNATILDNLLWDLMKVYVQDEDEEIFDNNNNKTYENNDSGKINGLKNDVNLKEVSGDNINNSMVSKCTKNNQPTEVIDEVTDEGDQIEKNSETTDMIEECSEDEESSTNGTEYNQSLNVDMSKNIAYKSTAEKATNVNYIERYQEELRQFLDENDDFEYQESFKINIKLNEYKLTNIRSEQFHGYENILFSNNIKCIVCDCVLDYEDAEHHKYDFEHLCRIVNFGSDGNYVREINESYSHCILCNEKMKNVDVVTHIESKGHYLNELRYSNTRDINREKSKDAITGTHINGNSSQANEKNTSNQTVGAIKPIEKNVDSIEHPYEVIAMGKVRCVVCECQVPSGVHNREEHLKGLRHRTTVLNKKHTTVEKNTGETSSN
ncbi:uncharacterized protein LOC133532669 [Cydia pomonella]|uniref:uncharacterized protein LOC133532669 n=1 Tax=Cydia pomonella TaxID=82600 RepID=UPI002ADDB64B|nr:uncharacterized protein LOC133532669 [Cydia pomonella]